MRHTRAVRWRGAESDAEYLVLIVIREQEHSRSRLLMFQRNPLGIQLFYVFFIQDLIALQIFYCHAVFPFSKTIPQRIQTSVESLLFTHT